MDVLTLSSCWRRWLPRCAVACLFGFLLLFAGCHLAFDGTLPTVHCTQPNAYGPPACPEKQSCVAGQCSDIGAPPGLPCATDGDCQPGGYCLDPAILGAQGDPVCSRGCCRSEDCGPVNLGQVCWPISAEGGAICQSAAHLKREQLGTKAGGESCDASLHCRSGRCVDGECTDTCCSDEGCRAAKDVCRVTASDGWADGISRTLWACEEPAYDDALAAGAECGTANDCLGSMCIDASDDALFKGFCGAPCCQSGDCGWISGALGLRPVACAVGIDGVPACSVLLDSAATGAVGVPCKDGSVCRSGECMTDNAVFVAQHPTEDGFCTDLCCNDEDCGESEEFVCRPMETGPKKKGASWSLRCVRK